jgi:hypothetical protein
MARSRPMRKLMTALTLGLAISSAADAFAQSQKQDNYEKDSVVSTGRRTTTAEQSISDRAATEARSRLARIESRHWAGVSLQRPPLYLGPFGRSVQRQPIRPWYVNGPSCYAYQVVLP